MDSSDSYEYYSSELYQDLLDPLSILDEQETPSQEINIHNIDDQLEDESQLLHSTLHSAPPSPPPVIAEDDPTVAFSTSLNQSKLFLSKHFAVGPLAFKHHRIPGLIVLRLEDFALIRNDNRRNRIIPHIMICPSGDNFAQDHPDFHACLQLLKQS